jgi:hypothetical protein
LTINEKADPCVVADMIRQLDLMVPWNQPFYEHAEGNSAAHLKASMMGFFRHDSRDGRTPRPRRLAGSLSVRVRRAHARGGSPA